MNRNQLRNLIQILEERTRNDLVQEALQLNENVTPLFRSKLAYTIIKAAYPQSVAHCLAVGETNAFDVVQLLYRKVLPVEATSEGDPKSMLALDTDNLREFLSSYEKVFVVAVYGKQGDGKSTLCNILSGNTHGAYKVGHSGGETTFGVFGSVIPHPNNPKLGLLLLDAEGCGVDHLRTSQILFLAAIAAGGLIFNFSGTLPGIAQVTLDSLEWLKSFLKKPGENNKNADRMAVIFSNMIVLQRNAGNSRNSEELQKLWHQHISAP